MGDLRTIVVLPAPAPRGAEHAERLWQELRAAAAALARQEAVLAPRLRRQVLARGSLAEALAAVLASRLACADMAEAPLFQLMHTVLASDAALIERVAADLRAVLQRDPAGDSSLHVLLNLKGYQALQTYRISHALWQRGRREAAHALASLASRAFAVDIHPAARLGTGIMLDHASGVVIGETAVLGDQVSLLQNVTLGGTGKDAGDRHPKIGDGVSIGAGATILGNIRVGSMSRVAAGSVVLQDVPANCTVAGVPARVVRSRAA